MHAAFPEFLLSSFLATVLALESNTVRIYASLYFFSIRVLCLLFLSDNIFFAYTVSAVMIWLGI